ncbi:DUF1015 domain-containing protein [Crocinitomix catalasitica]|uniref:DUF1015 domain-containing protein n=1 Tax=Crocinitomix catalasitica TaxID=184607 RepID=UPI0004892CD1|nr:DUF1015 family protein [Crocinitomix catalasitica]
MTVIKAFKAIRPTRDKAYLVATRPFYAYKQNVLDAKLEHNPYTFLHVINPEFHTGDKTKPNSPERFQKIRNKFDEFIRAGVLIQDEMECLYLYRQTKEGHQFTGLIGGASIDQYKEGHIKKHEDTITEREEVFSQYLKIVEFNVEPVLLFHRKHDHLNDLFNVITEERPEYEFSSTEKTLHEVWIIRDIDRIRQIQEYYTEIDDVYIADGHHRCASSARLAENFDKKESPNKNHFLAYYISEEKLQILDYNRLIQDLNGLSNADFIAAIQTNFIINEVNKADAKPTGLHEMSMYLDNKWYKLIAKEDTFDRTHPVSRLDTDILTKNILEPILNITDLKTNSRIRFLQGDKGMQGISDAVNSGKFKIGFGLFPVQVEHLKRVADEGLIMPPKSTWIEPKLRSGLTIFPLY